MKNHLEILRYNTPQSVQDHVAQKNWKSPTNDSNATKALRSSISSVLFFVYHCAHSCQMRRNGNTFSHLLLRFGFCIGDPRAFCKFELDKVSTSMWVFLEQQTLGHNAGTMYQRPATPAKEWFSTWQLLVPNHPFLRPFPSPQLGEQSNQAAPGHSRHQFRCNPRFDMCRRHMPCSMENRRNIDAWNHL